MASKLEKYTHTGKSPEEANIDFFYNKEMKEELKLTEEVDLDVFSWRTVEKFLELNPEYNELIDVYSKKNNLENIAILAAYGKNTKDKWVKENDGKYKALIIYSYNPTENGIYSKKSPVVVPSKDFSREIPGDERVPVDLYMPGLGQVDPYLFEDIMKKLKK